LSLRDTVVRVLVDRKKRAETSGELIFTHSGVSGPAVLTVSRQAVDALAAGAQVELVIDLAPDRDQQALNRYLLSQLAAHGKQRLVGVLKRMLPARLALECAEAAGISPDTPAHQLTAPERRRLSRCLKEFRLEVVGHRPLAEAIVTAGGIDTREVQPRTLASRLVSGLYFAGEVLDIDADTGGFNLQAAFSTGWVAGQSAAAGFVTGGPS
jgi:predicted Rossmann fold flavoprotein